MTAAVTAMVIKVISGPSDVFAADCERKTDGHTGEPQHKHRRQPNEQVHQGLLIVAATRAASASRLLQLTRVRSWATGDYNTDGAPQAAVRSKIFDGGRLGEGRINLPYRLRETNIKNLLVPSDVRARLLPAAPIVAAFPLPDLAAAQRRRLGALRRHRRGLLKPPFFDRMIFGILGGLGGNVRVGLDGSPQMRSPRLPLRARKEKQAWSILMAVSSGTS